VSKSTKQLALRKALSERLKTGDVILVDQLTLAAARTKEFVAVCRALGIQGSALFIVDTRDQSLSLAARNVPDVEITSSEVLNTYQVLRYDKLVFTRGAFEKLEKRLIQSKQT
jgi:large subunit ribosomal protein L4